MIDLRYPIGLFSLEQNVTAIKIEEWILDLEKAPNQLKEAVQDLSEEQLDTPYRPGGWTIRQVVHHLPDSHLNSYIRFKLALTKENPVIRPYHEDCWASFRIPGCLLTFPSHCLKRSTQDGPYCLDR